ncbi:MAG TPA: hypothetical protein VM597_30855 [Gemmataceae bacterium]|nr:hypothetical protein [Gemmataceae bacterium]
MAKKAAEDPSINKSQAIRDVLTGNPAIKSKDLIGQLAGKGIKVAPSLVYMVKSKLNKGRRKARRDRASAAAGAAVKNPVEVILRVKDLARELGGYRNLKQLVDLLAE